MKDGIPEEVCRCGHGARLHNGPLECQEAECECRRLRPIPWCCEPGCDKAAAFTITVHGGGCEDVTEACLIHIPEMAASFGNVPVYIEPIEPEP